MVILKVNRFSSLTVISVPIDIDASVMVEAVALTKLLAAIDQGGRGPPMDGSSLKDKNKTPNITDGTIISRVKIVSIGHELEILSRAPDSS
jgi:hypothetical protein